MKLKVKINSISLKLGLLFSAVFLGLLSLVGVILYAIFTNIFVDYLTEDLLMRGKNHATALGSNYNQKTIDHILTMTEGTRNNIIITDKDNQIVASSIPPDTDMKKHLLNETGKHNTPVIINEWRKHKYIVAITKIGKSYGHVYMFYPTSIIKDIVQMLNILFLITFIGMILLSVGLIGFLSDKLTRPLLRMKDATNRMAKGEYKQYVASKGNDEIAQLTESILQLGDQLQEFEDTRNSFLSDVSHELRTPLTYIQGYSDLIHKGIYKSNEELIEYVAIINKEAKRVSYLINDLFDMSKMESGKFELKKENTDIRDIVEKVVTVLTPAASKKGIMLHELSSDDLPMVYVDIHRIEQVIYNLVENAIKYTDAGEITVKSLLKNGAVILEVKDTGIGISEKELPEIWKRFYRVEKARTRKSGGSGLGLYVVKQIIHSHGREIYVSSREGYGSTFTIILK